MLACLCLVSSAQVNPRFFRVHFLTALGLTAVAAAFLRETDSVELWLAISAALILTCVGSIVWHLEGAPGGRSLIILATLTLASALILTSRMLASSHSLWLVADDVTSAALLGSATTAMLMGHSYLIAPAMSLRPLFTLLGALGASLAIRIGLAGVGLWLWTGETAGSNLEGELVLWLAIRWGIGFIGPLVLGWMAWETARIRSTQSATGILYVVVILCFLGELTSQLLQTRTGFVL
jgi:hypothetical protein